MKLNGPTEVKGPTEVNFKHGARGIWVAHSGLHRRSGQNSFKSIYEDA